MLRRRCSSSGCGDEMLMNVEQALAEQQRLRLAGREEWPGQILRRHGHVEPDHLAVALAEQRLADVS